MACQTWIEGTINRTFTASPAGTLDSNGESVAMDLINVFGFAEEDRIVVAHVRTDNRSFPRQLARKKPGSPNRIQVDPHDSPRPVHQTASEASRHLTRHPGSPGR